MARININIIAIWNKVESAGVVDGAFGRNSSTGDFKPQMEAVTRIDVEARCDGVGRWRHGYGFQTEWWPGVAAVCCAVGASSLPPRWGAPSVSLLSHSVSML